MNDDLTKARVEILIVEDSPTQAEKLKYILEDQGYSLAIVRNGPEALAYFEEHLPTLVISDVIMPEMDGYELCRRIKREEKHKAIPVILLTSLSDPADVVRGLESGADGFIFKPYETQYILARVAFTLANRHLRESENPQMGVEIFFSGRKVFITSDRLQILNLLLSTYEAAVHKNRELAAAHRELGQLNEHLETMVGERTAALEKEVAEREQAQSKLQSQLERLSLLQHITRAIAERQDLRSIFQVVIRSLEDQLPIDFGCVCLYDQGRNAFIVNCVGVRSEALAMNLAMTEQAHIAADQNGLLRCMRGQVVYEPDIAQVEFPFPRQLAGGGLRSLVVVPLLVESQVFGILVAARQEARSFSSSECEFLRNLSEHVALAANQAQLSNALKRASDDLRQTQKAVMQQERLRAIGQMASGIAHDINNAISPVALYTESLLEKEQNLSERARGHLETIQRAIEDVAATVARMKDFSRQRESQSAFSQIDLNELVQHVVDRTRARWNDMPQQQGVVIQMLAEFAPDLPAVMGVQSEIRDALTNLVFNAVDAMPEGGALTVRTRSISCENVEDGGGCAAPVHLEVCDTGVGMDEQTKQLCLEPFFTTKGERGTGLGLAMVYGMMQRLNGKIEIESAMGKGTTVRLIFPISISTATMPATLAAAPTPAQRLRILVVDDDPLVIQVLRDTLEDDGHLVISANGGQEGIEAFTAAQSGDEPFAVVITDLGMPYVDGRKVASAVKAASSSTPVILLTGWGERLIAEADVPPGVNHILNKPPKLRDLREALLQVTTSAI
jgi:CheY-like chemotaxis protein